MLTFAIIESKLMLLSREMNKQLIAIRLVFKAFRVVSLSTLSTELWDFRLSSAVWLYLSVLQALNYEILQVSTSKKRHKSRRSHKFYDLR